LRSKEFNHFKRLLQQAKTVLLSTHQLPDGDGLGTESALYYYLKKAGKKVTVLNPDPTPPRYQFLDPKHEYINKKSTHKASQLYDLWIIVDTNDPRRLGQLWGGHG
jgi:phosphoesterase RecJ-like protein